ncbi:hypothetical protein, partial [Burkholderia oklahomensis]|uniref:hypothetical protein n=1 Tax=Burkholderia oklahomensis TaxID=342113 RepID=UPI001E2C9017
PTADSRPDARRATSAAEPFAASHPSATETSPYRPLAGAPAATGYNDGFAELTSSAPVIRSTVTHP